MRSMIEGAANRARSGMFTSLLALASAALAFGHAHAAGVAASERDPQVIMKEVFRTGGAGLPRVAKLKLTVAPTGGERVEHVLQVRYKGEANARRAIMFVESAKQRNTGFVSIEYPGTTKAAERWIYLPTIKKTSRVAGDGMARPFLASDLSFSDLTQQDPSGFDLKLQKESDLVNGEDCWVIEGAYKDATLRAESGYSEVQVWISKSKLTMVRARLPLANSKVVKYMEGADFQKVGEQWTPKKLTVRKVQDGKVLSETTLETLELKLDDHVTDADFSKARLEAGI